MNNKKLGTKFEQLFCNWLAENGWWAHFLAPNTSGAQPFDVIAIRGNQVYAIDCKTCESDRFSFDRIQENQYLAFKSIMWKSSNVQCGFAIWHKEELFYIPFEDVLTATGKSIKLKGGHVYDARNRFE